MPRKVRPFIIQLFLLLLGTASVWAGAIRDLKPTVILISIDGFRYDYFARGKTPNLESLAARGVRAEYMIPSFPTKTFPNHYTIVTGLYPAHHGIIANTMWDSDLDATFKMADRKQVQDARWWGGEPIWVTAQKQGQKTAPFYWPGSEAAIEGMMPTYWMAYDDKHHTTFDYRVKQVATWLDLPVSERPTFITLYFEDVDHEGHDYGPGSSQVDQALERVDHAIGELLAELRQRGIEERVNIIVVSDHGMAPASQERLIVLDDYIDMRAVNVVDWSPVLAIMANDRNHAALYQKLKRIPHMSVYTPSTLPKRWHFRGNKRLAPVIGVADVGWTITSRKSMADKPNKKYGGDHGYDNAAPEMRAIFLAAGPAFRPHTTLKPFPNVDVYPLMAHLLHITPAKTDGSMKVFNPVLVPQAKAAAVGASR